MSAGGCPGRTCAAPRIACCGGGRSTCRRYSLPTPPPSLRPCRAAAFAQSFVNELRQAELQKCVECGDAGATARCAHQQCRRLFHLRCCGKCKVDPGGLAGGVGSLQALQGQAEPPPGSQALIGIRLRLALSSS